MEIPVEIKIKFVHKVLEMNLRHNDSICNCIIRVYCSTYELRQWFELKMMEDCLLNKNWYYYNNDWDIVSTTPKSVDQLGIYYYWHPHDMDSRRQYLRDLIKELEKELKTIKS